MGRGGQRAGAGRKASSITGIAARLPGDLGTDLLFEIQIAMIRVQGAGPRQGQMVADVIAALRRVASGSSDAGQ
jgi:hypothetical protein